MDGGLNDDVIQRCSPTILFVSCARTPFLNSNGDPEYMGNENVPILVHVRRTQCVTGTGNLDVKLKRPRSGTHPLCCQLIGACFFSLPRAQDIVMYEDIQRRVPKVFFGKGEYWSESLVGALQTEEDMTGLVLRGLLHSRVVQVVPDVFCQRGEQWVKTSELLGSYNNVPSTATDTLWILTFAMGRIIS